MRDACNRADESRNWNWEARASKIFALLEPSGMAFQIDVPPLLWSVRNSHASVCSRFRGGPFRGLTLDHVKVLIVQGTISSTDLPMWA